MDCREAQSLINQFIDDRMDDDTARAFIQHVRQCPSCYDDLEVNYTVMAVIRLLEDEDESLDLSRQLDHKIEEKETQIQLRYRRWIARRTAAVLACVASIFILFCGLMFAMGNVAPKSQLTGSRHAGIMNPMNIHRHPEAIDAFLYIKSGKKLRLVAPKSMPGTELFDIKRTSGNWGKLVIIYE